MYKTPVSLADCAVIVGDCGHMSGCVWYVCRALDCHSKMEEIGGLDWYPTGPGDLHEPKCALPVRGSRVASCNLVLCYFVSSGRQVEQCAPRNLG